ncbi:MAG: hypothetical protein HYX90_10560 [Chloroflexi bacterium]|nr:hypothetical protein [Chloroflexota bacterium]
MQIVVKELTVSGSRYIDLGTGSYVIQLALGVLLGGLTALKIFWKRLMSKFRKDS